MAEGIESAARDDLAPSGTLRVGINFGNPLLASRAGTDGEPRGIAVDLGREVGHWLDVPVEIVGYEAAGRMAAAAIGGAWDVAFLAVDPLRARTILFTSPYLDIACTYLVPAGSPIRDVPDVDREGVRVAVSGGSAYDLVLTRTLQHARLERAPSVAASGTLFTDRRMDVLAGLEPWLAEVARRLPGSRVLEGHFATVHQAVATPRGRDAGFRSLNQFVERCKASGLVARTIRANGVSGVSVSR